ncbi:MAG TPA: cytochrome c [Gammaproteobacteria bacterium]|nr:cytochrome c [Gammaproteobacteria bacterium]
MRNRVHPLTGLSTLGTLLALALALLGGCDAREDTDRGSASPASTALPPRVSDRAVLARGKRLFEQNCAVCHGARAEGAPDWRYRGPDGKFPPPPLNGTGHSWHHPYAWLHQMIKNGSPPGQGNMPAWGGKLSDEDIDAVIAWFQSLWPQPAYEGWVEIQRRSQGRPGG